LLEGPLKVDLARIAALRSFVRTGGDIGQYEPRPFISYARPSSVPGVNSLGFLDDEFPLAKRPGVPRIVCLGSSTTEGGNPAGHKGSYPFFLGEILRERTGHPVESFNFAMSGWTTAETLVAYFLLVQDYAPDVVLVSEAPNDVEPRSWPGFRADYSHYRQTWKPLRFSWPYRMLVEWSDFFAARQLRSVTLFGIQAVVVRPPQGPYTYKDNRLPPETAAVFRRNVRTIVEHVRLRGGHAVLVTVPYDLERPQSMAGFRSGIDEHNQILRELAQSESCALVDLQELFRRENDGRHALFLDLVHVTPEGNRVKAAAIADVLVAAGLVR
jgi:lysophospholipase L1-like esterase